MEQPPDGVTLLSRFKVEITSLATGAVTTIEEVPHVPHAGPSVVLAAGLTRRLGGDGPELRLTLDNRAGRFDSLEGGDLVAAKAIGSDGVERTVFTGFVGAPEFDPVTTEVRVLCRSFKALMHARRVAEDRAYDGETYLNVLEDAMSRYVPGIAVTDFPTGPVATSFAVKKNTKMSTVIDHIRRAVNAALNQDWEWEVEDKRTSLGGLGTPLLYYKFDEFSGTTAKNSVAPGSNDGTLVGGATFEPARWGYGVRLDGVNDEVTFGDPSNIEGIANLSIGFWMRWRGSTIDTRRTLVGKGKKNAEAKSTDPQFEPYRLGDEYAIWQMDDDDIVTGGKTRDAGGNRRHLLVSGADHVAGKYGKAYRQNVTRTAFTFDAQGGSFALNQWTMMGWVKRTVGGTTSQGLAGKANAGSRDYWVQTVWVGLPGLEKPRLRAGFTDTGGTERTVETADDEAPAQDVYDHVAVTFNGTNIKIYLNKTLKVTSADFSAHTPRQTVEEFRLGTLSGATGTLGDFDEWRVYPRALSATEIADVVDNPYYSQDEDVVWVTLETTGKVRARFQDDAGKQYSITSTKRVDDGRWHHVEAYYETGGTLRLFIDGAEDATAVTHLGNPTAGNAHQLRAGHKDSATSDFFNGDLDDLRFYGVGFGVGGRIYADANALVMKWFQRSTTVPVGAEVYRRDLLPGTLRLPLDIVELANVVATDGASGPARILDTTALTTQAFETLTDGNKVIVQPFKAPATPINRVRFKGRRSSSDPPTLQGRVVRNGRGCLLMEGWTRDLTPYEYHSSLNSDPKVLTDLDHATSWSYGNIPNDNTYYDLAKYDLLAARHVAAWYIDVDQVNDNHYVELSKADNSNGPWTVVQEVRIGDVATGFPKYVQYPASSHTARYWRVRVKKNTAAGQFLREIALLAAKNASTDATDPEGCHTRPGQATTKKSSLTTTPGQTKELARFNLGASSRPAYITAAASAGGDTVPRTNMTARIQSSTDGVSWKTLHDWNPVANAVTPTLQKYVFARGEAAQYIRILAVDTRSSGVAETWELDKVTLRVEADTSDGLLFPLIGDELPGSAVTWGPASLGTAEALSEFADFANNGLLLDADRYYHFVWSCAGASSTAWWDVSRGRDPLGTVPLRTSPQVITSQEYPFKRTYSSPGGPDGTALWRAEFNVGTARGVAEDTAQFAKYRGLLPGGFLEVVVRDDSLVVQEMAQKEAEAILRKRKVVFDRVPIHTRLNLAIEPGKACRLMADAVQGMGKITGPVDIAVVEVHHDFIRRATRVGAGDVVPQRGEAITYLGSVASGGKA